MQASRLMIDLSPLRTSTAFRLVFSARVVSLLGIALTTVGVPWQVFDMTRSSLQVSVAAAVVGTTTFAGTLAGGVIADRFDRRKVILVSRGGATVVFAALAVNAVLPDPQLWLIYLCVGLNGATAVSQSALMAVTPAIVPREQLAAAGALVALSTQVGAVIGPSAAGVLIAGPGLAVNFGLCAAGSLVTTALLWFLPALPPQGAPTARPLHSIAEGASFVAKHPVVRGVLLIDVAAMVFALPYVLFPQLAIEVFSAGPEAVGLLYTAPAVGAMVAALTSGWTTHVHHSGRVLVVAVLAYGAAIAGVGFAGSLPLALAFLAVAGACDMISEVLRRALLAHCTPDHLQGRVSSVWLAQATVGPSAGGVEAGVASRLLGPGPAVATGGAICVVATAALAASLPPLRRVSLRADAWAAHPAEPTPGIPERAPLEPEAEIEGAVEDPVEGLPEQRG
ncbi:enterobactin transporter EntS [Actinomycetospora cinnamomea]|uniref:ENTS family enterobactin (Siderophore) exporter n=1 Tax=Actinomycetospora cinnamomea TaxID=663609 RepID=A0A2U1FRA1_9PSEU|nr:enterobactin transporter EntS [Actinomycetospora cinnamomea]PVZ14652.1 ENTS family enterobactin (siderophore) exporter [Actinomycetospora cinnamomea]